MDKLTPEQRVLDLLLTRTRLSKDDCIVLRDNILEALTAEDDLVVHQLTEAEVKELNKPEEPIKFGGVTICSKCSAPKYVR